MKVCLIGESAIVARATDVETQSKDIPRWELGHVLSIQHEAVERKDIGGVVGVQRRCCLQKSAYVDASNTTSPCQFL